MTSAGSDRSTKFFPRSREFIMAESKIKAEGESNDISAGRQGLEVDETTLNQRKQSAYLQYRRIFVYIFVYIFCLHCLHLLCDEANKIKPQNIERA